MLTFFSDRASCMFQPRTPRLFKLAHDIQYLCIVVQTLLWVSASLRPLETETLERSMSGLQHASDSRTSILMPATEHTATIILLHGRDSGATEFASEFFESQTSDGHTLPEIFPGFRWVLPTADMIMSARFGVFMSQWFDMLTTEDPHERELEQDLSAVITRIQNVVARESTIIGASNVVLGGISQGCAVALHALLRQNLTETLHRRPSEVRDSARSQDMLHSR
jgi:predicted esterase